MTDLRDPLTLAPLSRRPLGGGCAVWEGGSRVWPEVDGIPYLRVGRDELADRVVSLLESGDAVTARAELLRDQDDFARQPPPTLEATLAISREEPPTFREAMRRLEYGPVAHYFAHRTSTPTYLSGLALLHEVDPQNRLLEVCCGAGHFLREIELRSEEWTVREGDDSDEFAVVTAGVDVVWSKLWLARTYLSVRGTLVCADVCAGRLPFPNDAFNVGFCHDAIYFLPEKAAFLDDLRRAAGSLLIGHAHNRLADHGDVAGTPLSPGGYAAIAPKARFYDDAVAARVSLDDLAYEDGPVSHAACEADSLNDCEAVCFAEWVDGADRGHLHGRSVYRRDDRRLRLNPLLVERGGQLVPDWPMPRFAEEYAGADYLTGPVPTAEQVAKAAAGEWAGDPEMEDFVRRRTFIDLPERW